MQRFKKYLKTIREKHFTIMLIPHSNSKTFKISIPLYIIYLGSMISFVTVVATTYIVSRHVDYLSVIANNIILQNKVEYFSRELIKNKNFLEDLKEVDNEMRLLLGLKTKKNVIEAEGIGGALLMDEALLDKYMNNQLNFNAKQFNAYMGHFKKEFKNQKASTDEIFKYIKKQRQINSSKPQMWPTTGRITSRFGSRVHPLTGRIEFHRGIDIANKKGTPILATSDGKVRYASRWGSYGKVVIIDHGNGYTTRYAHLNKMLVKRRQKIEKGDIIARMGNTGISTGTHVHYEVRYRNRPQNPLYFVGKYKK
ncbi:M23 family metallopeptidase [bacterium]